MNKPNLADLLLQVTISYFFNRGSSELRLTLNSLNVDIYGLCLFHYKHKDLGEMRRYSLNILQWNKNKTKLQNDPFETTAIVICAEVWFKVSEVHFSYVFPIVSGFLNLG